MSESQGMNHVSKEMLARVKQIEEIQALSPCLDYTMAESLLILSEQGKLQGIVDAQLEREKNCKPPEVQAVYKGMISVSDPEEEEENVVTE